MIRNILAAASIAVMLATPALANDRDEAKAARKFDKKFREVVQPIQYDGDYSPAAGRLPDPEPSATVPVRFVPAWKRQIPIIVPPAPRYVDPPAQNQQGQQDQQGQGGQGQNGTTVPGVAFGGAQGSYLTTAPPAPAAPGAAEDVVPGLTPVTGAGSATGSTAYPTYGAPSTTTQTTVERVTTETTPR